MAATLDATVAGASSNSYVTIAQAETYFETRLRATAWELADATDRTKALIEATRRIEALPLRSWRAGNHMTSSALSALEAETDWERVTDEAQALAFPRLRDVDSDGSYIIPPSVQFAQCEEALALLSYGDESDKRARLQRAGVKTFSVDGLSESYVDGVAASSGELRSPEAMQYLDGFLRRFGVVATSDRIDGELSPGSQGAGW